MTEQKPGRNDKCRCGSGKKFKQCCERKAPGDRTWQLLLVGLVGVLVAAMYFVISAARHDSSAAPADGRVWSSDHGHYH